jgi:lysophospholipase L1-like esterase
MKTSIVLAVALALVIPSWACGTKASGAAGSQSDASDAMGAMGSVEDGGTVDSGGPMWDGADLTTIAMTRISGTPGSGRDGGVPAFASSNANSAVGPSNANDDSTTTSWSPAQLPAWIAYDLSGVPVAERQSALVAWNAEHAGGYINTTPPSGGDMPTDYTIEINSAPGGSSAAPASGWVQVAAVSHNLRNTVENPIEMSGANWVRMSITGSSDPNVVAIDLDVFSTPNGATDSWLFMGDSITFITMGYAFSDIPQLVHQSKPARWPAIINAAIGGTSTATAAHTVIEQTMSGFPGRYVVLAYGTNDLPSDFQMESLVMSVIAAGKIPVVPLMPWSAVSNIQTNGPMINAAIAALYAKYPQIVRGPDLWSAFMNRTDLIPSGDVHPNSAGQAFLRQQWAQVIAAIP